MNLYIKQKVFSWNDKFSIFDENGNERFYVEGEVFSFGKKLRIYDLAGTELAYIEQKVWSFLPKYNIYRDGELIATGKLTDTKSPLTIAWGDGSGGFRGSVDLSYIGWKFE